MQTERVSSEELSIWLAFESLKGFGLGSQRVLKLYDRFRNIQEAWEAPKAELIGVARMAPDAAEALVQERKKIDPMALLEKAWKSDVTCLAFSDPAYPYLLRQIHDPPIVLFVKGEIGQFDFNNVVGIVGTRRPTAYGQKYAKEISHQLAANGAIIASGLAIGVDSIAHWGAIEGNGRTIAVVGTGPDLCYPSSNRRLYKTILDGHGLILSEFFPGVAAEKWHFPARNRIISGLSKAVAVIEAGETSGALITARIAFEQNRDVFAIPGRIDNPMSVGTNGLIKKQMAQLAAGADDILDAMKWVRTSINQVTTIVELYGREKEIYEMISNEPVHFDVLCQRSGMNPGEMSATLTMLELAGLVLRHAGDWYSRQDSPTPRPQQATLPSM